MSGHGCCPVCERWTCEDPDGGEQTAIDKRPVTGRAAVRALGVDGDEQADLVNHGGIYQAVYAYAREDLDWWERELGRDLRDGMFGENLTLRGIDITGAVTGERWQVGTTVLEVTTPRVPCAKFRSWMGEKGWVKWFAAAERPGAYLRVLEEGEIGAGDQVEVVFRPDDARSILELFRSHYARS